VFRIERRSAEFLAQWILPVAIFPCEVLRDPLAAAALGAVFEKGGRELVTRLCRTDAFAEEACWLPGPGWCLAYA
jgi:protein-L-isoaspartate(D-aspartate) O-methyltransferase